MPGETLEDIALRSTNPVKRAIDVMCVVVLQLLTRMVLAAEQNPDKCRNHPAFGRCSILARLEAGETFDLPLFVIAAIRAVVTSIGGDLRRYDPGVEQPSSQIQATCETSTAPSKAARRRATARPTPKATHRVALKPRQSTPSLRRVIIPGFTERIANFAQYLPTPISLRYRNERTHFEA